MWHWVRAVHLSFCRQLHLQVLNFCRSHVCVELHTQKMLLLSRASNYYDLQIFFWSSSACIWQKDKKGTWIIFPTFFAFKQEKSNAAGQASVLCNLPAIMNMRYLYRNHGCNEKKGKKSRLLHMVILETLGNRGHRVWRRKGLCNFYSNLVSWFQVFFKILWNIFKTFHFNTSERKVLVWTRLHFSFQWKKAPKGKKIITWKCYKTYHIRLN